MTSLTGAGALIRLILRRDHTRLAVWVVVIAGLVLSTASSLQALYPDVAGRLKFGASVVSNPTLLALDGPLFNAASIGGLTAWRYGGFAAVFAALMSILTVVRHTRSEEEAGRTEFVSAGVVGRLAPLSAALVVAAVANVATGLLILAGLAGLGLGLAGSFALGFGVAAAGFAFAAIAAVAAQFPDSGRAANGIACSALGAAFLLRAIGDGSGTGTARWLSWLSPIGWAQQIRPYAHERWWVFALPVALAGVLITVAYALVGRRDVGAGLVRSRRGVDSASPRLASAFALAWRQHRGTLLGWSIAFAITGAAIGSSARSVGDLVSSSSQLEDVMNRLGGRGSITDAYFAAIAGLWGLIAAAYGIQATLRMRSEETGLRAEPLLATPVGRLRWAAGHIVLAVAGTGVLLVVAGLGAGLTYGATTHDLSGQVPRLVGSSLIQWPAAVVFAGIGVALFGLVPRLCTLAWAVLAALGLLTQIGVLLRLGQPVMDLSPFTHVPKIPGGTLAATPMIALTAVAVAFGAVGLAGFRRRDIG